MSHLDQFFAPCSLLTLKAEDALIWFPPHDPSLLHVWYGKSHFVLSLLPCLPGVRHCWCFTQVTSAGGVLLSCRPKKPPGKDSVGSSPCSTGPWRKLMPHLVSCVPHCKCGCARHIALWALTKVILVSWESRKL